LFLVFNAQKSSNMMHGLVAYLLFVLNMVFTSDGTKI
jgi:hypothetical protein